MTLAVALCPVITISSAIWILSRDRRRRQVIGAQDAAARRQRRTTEYRHG